MRVKRIVISSYLYSPGTLRVRPGAKVKVVNKDFVSHSVSSDDGTSFDAKVGGDQSMVFRAPATPGKYAYHCYFHSSMHGLLIVKG